MFDFQATTHEEILAVADTYRYFTQAKLVNVIHAGPGAPNIAGGGMESKNGAPNDLLDIYIF